MRFALASFFLHGLLVAGMIFFIPTDSAHVEGSAGLAGNPGAHFEVTMEAVTTPPAAEKAPDTAPVEAPPPVAEGLPVDVKHESPREIDEAPTPPKEAVAETSEGDSPNAEAGSPGQGGTGGEPAAKLGDSDRTDRLGLYLQKMHRKIQANLGPAGYLPFPAKAKLLLDLKKDGRVTKITVLESSGDAALDRLAIRAVQKANPFDPWEEDLPVELPVVFR